MVYLLEWQSQWVRGCKNEIHPKSPLVVQQNKMTQSDSQLRLAWMQGVKPCAAPTDEAGFPAQAADMAHPPFQQTPGSGWTGLETVTLWQTTSLSACSLGEILNTQLAFHPPQSTPFKYGMTPEGRCCCIAGLSCMLSRADSCILK